MEYEGNVTRLGRFSGSAASVARQALEIVVGVLLADRELNSDKYEDLFHMPW
ncbi:MAG: hypothetical protein R6X16_03840 [Anaerolineae bacterium]|jgi:hypothetical protein